ncbi:MAG: hypothetical protein ACRCVI_01760 [Mycoplasmoidaceae bacterium]
MKFYMHEDLYKLRHKKELSLEDVKMIANDIYFRKENIIFVRRTAWLNFFIYLFLSITILNYFGFFLFYRDENFINNNYWIYYFNLAISLILCIWFIIFLFLIKGEWA